MKKIIVVFAVLGSLIGGGRLLSAANQPQSLGLVRVQISSGTLAQIDQTVPLGSFELVGCTDCVQATICVSTGTGKGAFVVSASSHSVGSAASLVHCR